MVGIIHIHGSILKGRIAQSYHIMKSDAGHDNESYVARFMLHGGQENLPMLGQDAKSIFHNAMPPDMF